MADAIETNYPTIPPLSHQETCALIRRWQKGLDFEAREKLILANVRFVVSVAKKYLGRGLTLQELVAEGNIGLLIAADRFDAGLGWRFISYAVWWIKQSILTALHNTHTVRQPVCSGALVNRVLQTQRAMEMSLGRTCSAREALAAMLPKASNETMDYHLDRLAGYEPATRLDAPCLGHPHQQPWLQVAAGRVEGLAIASDAEEKLLVQQQRELIADLLHLCTPREQLIVRMYFGLNDHEPMTLTTIGKRLGLTRERIRQVRNQALKRMGKAREEVAEYL